MILCLRNMYFLKLHLHICNKCSFFITYGMALYKPTVHQQTPTCANQCICERAGVSELRRFWHFYIIKVLFLSIFCWHFVGTNDMLVGLHVYRQISKCTDKTLKNHYGGGGGFPLPHLATLVGMGVRMGIVEQPFTNKHFKAYFKKKA